MGQIKRTFHEMLYEHFRDIWNKDLMKPLEGHFPLPNHTPDTTQVTSHILPFITKPSNTSAAQEMRLRIECEWVFRRQTTVVSPLASMLWTNSLDTPLLPALFHFFEPHVFMGLSRGTSTLSSRSLIPW